MTKKYRKNTHCRNGPKIKPHPTSHPHSFSFFEWEPPNKAHWSSAYLEPGISRSNNACERYMRTVKEEVTQYKSLGCKEFLSKLAEFISYKSRESTGKYIDNILYYDKDIDSYYKIFVQYLY